MTVAGRWGRRAGPAAAALIAAVALSACAGSSGGSGDGLPPPSYPPSPVAAQGHRPAAAAVHAATPAPAAPLTATTPLSAAAAPVAPAFDGLKPGDTGPAVLALQQRLQSLGFWIASTDGTYGDTTSQAVLALQKASGLTRDGVAGPRTRQVLAAGVHVGARTSSGHWIEIDKARQLLLLVDSGTVSTILNTSTGSDQPYSYGGHNYTANTPTGSYAVFRQVDHLDTGPLGDLWRPKYFNGGIAVHGAASVPAYPASHGCTRVSDAAMNWIWATDKAPIGTRVMVY